MPVYSKKTSLFSARGRKFFTLDSAEAYIRSLSEDHTRLEKVDEDEISSSTTKIQYALDPEPYINAGPDQYLLCGQIINLSCSVTGVPFTDLTFEWLQLKGLSGIFTNPSGTSTAFIREDGDNSDKTFAFKVLNRDTGVFNSDRVRMFATPTEVVYYSAGGENLNRLFKDDWVNPVFSIANRPNLDSDPDSSDSAKGILINDASFFNDLEKVEIEASTEGFFFVVEEFNYPNLPNFFEIPIAFINSVAPGTVIFGRLKFTYNFRGVRNIVYSDIFTIYTGGETLQINERLVFLGYNKQDNSYYLGTDELRQGPAQNFIVEDPHDPSFRQTFEPFNITSDSLRYTRIEVIGEDTVTTPLLSNTFTNFLSELQRDTGGQIGGG